MCKTHGVMELASQQLLRAIRGKRSQVAFSRRLGYRGNPAAEWETGRHFPTAAQTLSWCQRSGIDVKAAVRRFNERGAHALRSLNDAGVAAWLRELRGKTPLSDVAARAERSRFAVSRWLSGQARPRLPDFLRLLDALTGRASDLVFELVSIDAVPALKAHHAARSAAKRLAFEQPWTEAIMRVIETTAYAAAGEHKPGWISKRLGIDLDVEVECLARMEQAGVVVRDGGRYRAPELLTVDTQAAPEDLVRLKTHWNRVAAARIGAPGPSDVLAYNVFSSSAADLGRIKSLLRATFREIRSIVAASEPIECVALVNLQLVGWDEA
jgi:hypothetical protein